VNLLEVATSSSPVLCAEAKSWLKRYVRAGAAFSGSWGQVDAAANGHDVATPRYLAGIGVWGALWEVSASRFQTGARVVAECASVSAVAFVPATRGSTSCAVALRRRGAWGGGGAGASVWVYVDGVGRELRGHGCERLGAHLPHVGAAGRGGWWGHGM